MIRAVLVAAAIAVAGCSKNPGGLVLRCGEASWVWEAQSYCVVRCADPARVPLVERGTIGVVVACPPPDGGAK